MQADINYPIDIMFWKKRWLILDGLHRLMKQAIEGRQTVQVRKIPESAIPLITKEQFKKVNLDLICKTSQGLY